MGNCAPRRDDGSEMIDVQSKEVMDQSQLIEKLTIKINSYKQENENLRLELETINSGDKGDNKAQSEAEKIEELVKELAAMKDMVEVKDRVLAEHQLEAAVHSNVFFLESDKTSTNLIKAGGMKLHETGTSTENLKWVEVNLYSGTDTDTGLTKGHLVLTLADTKGSLLVNRCEILRINEKSDVKNKTFSVDVTLSGRENELVFACDDEKETMSWVEAIEEGFRQIKDDMSVKKSGNADVSNVDEDESSKEKPSSHVEEKLIVVEDKGESKQTDEMSAPNTVNNDMIISDELSKEKLDHNVLETRVEEVEDDVAGEAKSTHKKQVEIKQTESISENDYKDKPIIIRAKTYKI